MKKYLGLLLLLVSFTSFGQFSNYTNINGRYKWIAGKFDSTFTIPSGTTPSLRVGGGTGPGALFYSTTDSTVYQYTGTRWTRLRGTDTAHVVSAYVRNTTASVMTAGQVVYINGSTGTTPTIALAVNTADSTSAMTFGFVRGTIAVNGFGWITTFGPLEGVNTNAYTEGEVIYLDSIPGQFTHDKPQAPYHMVTLGYIIKKSGGNGTIYAKVQNGYELDELHNVRITEPVLNKSVIIYDSVRRLWVDTTVSAAGLGLGGSGTTNYVSKWTSSTALGNSQIFDNGTSVGIGTATPSASYLLDVVGKSRFTNTTSDAFVIDLGTTGVFKVLRNSVSHLQYDANTFTTTAFQLTSQNLNTYNSNQTRISGGVLQFTGGAYINAISQELAFWLGGSEKARFTPSGRLLIGTTTESTFELDVVGDIRSTLDANINGLTVGKGGASGAGNTVLGSPSIGVTTGTNNTIIGQGITGLSSSLSNTIILADGQGNQRLYINNVGNVGIGTTSPNASSLLDVSSTTQGFLPPRMTNAQMVAIATPAAGLVVYDTTNNKLNVYDGTNWATLH